MGVQWTEIGDCRIACADAREALADCGPVDSIIVDPVWPNAHPDLIGHENPYSLFADCMRAIPRTHRLVVWLGCQSDPRFLAAVPASLPFLRMGYLRRAVPSYNGRCLVTGDVIYAFGEWTPAAKGKCVIPGECSVTSKPKLRVNHPCARNHEHAEWVVKWWSVPGEVVLDFAMGSGTTATACIRTGRKFVGVEIDPRHFELACQRIEKEYGRMALLETPPVPRQLEAF